MTTQPRGLSADAESGNPVIPCGARFHLRQSTSAAWAVGIILERSTRFPACGSIRSMSDSSAAQPPSAPAFSQLACSVPAMSSPTIMATHSKSHCDREFPESALPDHVAMKRQRQWNSMSDRTGLFRGTWKQGPEGNLTCIEPGESCPVPLRQAHAVAPANQAALGSRPYAEAAPGINAASIDAGAGRLVRGPGIMTAQAQGSVPAFGWPTADGAVRNALIKFIYRCSLGTQSSTSPFQNLLGLSSSIPRTCSVLAHGSTKTTGSS